MERCLFLNMKTFEEIKNEVKSKHLKEFFRFQCDKNYKDLWFNIFIRPKRHKYGNYYDYTQPIDYLDEQANITITLGKPARHGGWLIGSFYPLNMDDYLILLDDLIKFGFKLRIDYPE